MISDYERQRAIQIAKNKDLLKSLGLEKPLFEPKEKRRNKSQPLKRKAPEEAEDIDEPVPKIQREENTKTGPENESSGLRRSSRNPGKRIDYSKEQNLDSPQPVLQNKLSGNDGPMGREAGKRIHDPKTYGHIPNVPVGTWWLTREACSRDAVHAPWVGGISGGPQGAYSVALSGGYDDDIDLGYAFPYTGSGGRDLKGTKSNPKNLRTAPQSSDQSFENNFNKMLQRSSETMKPVRVVRGYKLQSRYAPFEGYRYDGLYKVERAWMDKGFNEKGYLVCKFAFKRLPNQPPLPVNDEHGDEEVEKDESALVEDE